jgi:hypothetical protein
LPYGLEIVPSGLEAACISAFVVLDKAFFGTVIPLKANFTSMEFPLY